MSAAYIEPAFAPWLVAIDDPTLVLARVGPYGASEYVPLCVPSIERQERAA